MATLALRSSFFLCLLLPSGDWNEAKSRFLKEWGTAVPAQQQAAARLLASEDHAEGAALLLQSVESTERILRELSGRQQQIREEMAKYPADEITNEKGEIIRRDWYEKRLALDRDLKEVAVRSIEQERVLETVAGVLGGFSGNGAVTVVVRQFRRTGRLFLRPFLIPLLGRYPQEEAFTALVEALDQEKDPCLVVLCVDAVTLRGGERALPVLLPLLASKEWTVQLAACRNVARLDAAESIPALIEAMSASDGRIRHEIALTLVLLTGENRHDDPSAWRFWWESAREAFPTSRPPRREREKFLQQVEEGTDGATTRFYGIPVVSKRIAFVLDRSGSMELKSQWKSPNDVPTGEGASEPVGDRKIDVCKFELKNVIRKLADDARFTILFYNRDLQAMPKSGLLTATRSNKEKTFRFLREIEPTGRTNLFDSLEKAMLPGEVDTIFLLSDGMPNCGQFERAEDVLSEIRKRNASRKIVIHAIYTGDEKPGLDLMAALARENGGQFVDRSRAADPKAP